MDTRELEEEVNNIEEYGVDSVANEANPSTKLEQRRRIEDLFEEKRLREELSEFG